MILTEADLAYLHTIIPVGSNLYYATRFIPEDYRHWQLPLYALYETLNNIPDECSDPGVARMKIHWWLEQLSNKNLHESAHPLIKILSHCRQELPITKNQLSSFIQSALNKLECHEFIDDSQYTDYHLYTRGAVTSALAQLCGINEEDEAILSLAKTISAAESLLLLAKQKQHGRCLLPPSLLSTYQVNHQYSPKTNLDALLNDLKAQIQTQQPHAAPPASLAGEWIYCQLLLKTLDLAKLHPSDLLQQQISLSPLRKCWTAWRAKLS